LKIDHLSISSAQCKTVSSVSGQQNTPGTVKSTTETLSSPAACAGGNFLQKLRQTRQTTWKRQKPRSRSSYFARWILLKHMDEQGSEGTMD
jgi:hypothetical protein